MVEELSLRCQEMGPGGALDVAGRKAREPARETELDRNQREEGSWAEGSLGEDQAPGACVATLPEVLLYFFPSPFSLGLPGSSEPKSQPGCPPHPSPD